MKSHFGFTEEPFTKDLLKKGPFVSSQVKRLHQELKMLLATRGIGLISGEVGTGKTSAVEIFTRKLSPNQYRPIYLYNLTCRPKGFYATLASALELEPRFQMVDLVNQVSSALKTLANEHRRYPLLIIDEVQNLRGEVLEHIRLLTNFEMDTASLLTVLLVGLPTVKNRLKTSPYEALKQRITMHFHFAPLDVEETIRFIDHQLKLAGKVNGIFTDDAKGAIFHYSRGTLRDICTIARKALELAVEENKKQVEERLVHLAAKRWQASME